MTAAALNSGESCDQCQEQYRNTCRSHPAEKSGTEFDTPEAVFLHGDGVITNTLCAGGPARMQFHGRSFFLPCFLPVMGIPADPAPGDKSERRPGSAGIGPGRSRGRRQFAGITQLHQFMGFVLFHRFFSFSVTRGHRGRRQRPTPTVTPPRPCKRAPPRWKPRSRSTGPAGDCARSR